MNQPPPPNPAASAYESFVKDTPIITRYVMSTYTVSFIASMFLPVSMAIINIPYFTIFKFELYRLILSNFVCKSFLSLIFGFLSFVDTGKRLEFSIGSTNFALILLFIGIGSNVLFTLVSLVTYACSGNHQPHLLHTSGGLWQTLLGIISMECSYAQEGSKRRLFFIEVPTFYYPFALLALFTLAFGLGKGSILFNLLPFVLSMGIGYAYGFGKLEFLKLNVERRRRLEYGMMRSFTSRLDWVAGPATDDWVMIAPAGVDTRDNNTDIESGWTPTLFQPQENQTNTNPSSGGGNRLGEGGNTLPGNGIGMTTRRSNDERAARQASLAAAERRVKEQNRK